MVEIEHCPMCESTNIVFVGRLKTVKGYKRFECRDCAGQFFLPRIAAPIEYYDSFPEAAVFKRWEFDIAKQEIEKSGTRAHLDVGAGNGAFLSLLNLEIRIALEPSSLGPISADCEEQRVASFDEVDELIGSVSAFHVLEHVTDPRDFLTAARRVMPKNGRLYISFPNPLRYEASLYQDIYDLPPNHLNIVSQKAMSVMLDATGFKLVETIKEPQTKPLFRLGSNQFYASIRENISPTLAQSLSSSRAFNILKPAFFAPFIAYCAVRGAFSKTKTGYTIMYIAKAV